MDKGMIVSTPFFDLKGAYNNINHRVVAEAMAEEGYAQKEVAWVLSFLDGHRTTIVIDGKETVTVRITKNGGPQGSALTVAIFQISINRLLRKLAHLTQVSVNATWKNGFVDDVNFSTASRSIMENVRKLEEAGRVAKEWEAVDKAKFEEDKTELLHAAKGRGNYSAFSVKFGSRVIEPLEEVKWVGIWLDRGLTGKKHVEMRAASAVRAMNATVAVMHASWGMRPILIRDLIQSTIFPRADYGVAAFLPMAPKLLKPLERVNRSAARCITGSFRTASLAALEKEAAILPAHLRIERDALLTVARYLTLPPDHGIHRHLKDALANSPKDIRMASLYHHLELVPGIRWPKGVPERGQRLRGREVRRQEAGKMHQSVGEEPLDATLGMEPIRPIYAPPWMEPLPVSTNIMPKEGALEALECALRDGRVAKSTWYTDGSLLDGRAGGAAVRVEHGREKERIKVPLGRGQVCEGEMEGLLKATERAIQDGHAQILCVADSQAALRGILSTKPRSGQFRAIFYDQLIRSAQAHLPHLAITNLWTPAHIGTAGNELADEAAKAATEMEADPSLFVSLTTVQRLIHLQVLAKWQGLWERSKTGKSLRAVDKSPPSLRLSPLYASSTLTRRTISVISRLRTGPSHLNAHRHKSGFIQSPACEACGEPFETRAHYLLQCPTLEPLRQPLHDAAKRAGHYGSLHVSPLLSEPKVLKALGVFIEASRRFETH
jgi:ribonuclease HI